MKIAFVGTGGSGKMTLAGTAPAPTLTAQIDPDFVPGPALMGETVCL